jgi:hypothetical protein
MDDLTPKEIRMIKEMTAADAAYEADADRDTKVAEKLSAQEAEKATHERTNQESASEIEMDAEHVAEMIKILFPADKLAASAQMQEDELYARALAEELKKADECDLQAYIAAEKAAEAAEAAEAAGW